MKPLFDKTIHEGRSLTRDDSALGNISEPLAIDGFAYIHLWAANARQATFYYAQAMGFTPFAYRGPETNYRDGVTYALRQGDAMLLISSPLSDESMMASFIHRHGDSIQDTAFAVPNCEAFYYEALRRGAESAEEPMIWEDEHGSVKRAAIKTYGDNIHSIVERQDYKGTFWPGFVAYTDIFPALPQHTPAGLMRIDHVVGNVELGKMEYWASFYERVLDFTQITHFTDEDISTEYSALMSKVMRNGSGKIKLPINEPAEGKRKSQIEDLLDFHRGPGVQHVALATNDILHTVFTLRNNGINFLRVPKTYYDGLHDRVGDIKENVGQIAELGVLVDRDDDGYLLQLFSKAVHDRPTLFFEVIQREGSEGFGVGNFKALFEALELEQASRGNL